MKKLKIRRGIEKYTLFCIFCQLIGNINDFLDVLMAQFRFLTLLLKHTTVSLVTGKGSLVLKAHFCIGLVLGCLGEDVMVPLEILRVDVGEPGLLRLQTSQESRLATRVKGIVHGLHSTMN